MEVAIKKGSGGFGSVLRHEDVVYTYSNFMLILSLSERYFNLLFIEEENQSSQGHSKLD